MSTDHGRFEEWLDLQVEGELGPAERRQLAGHVDGCARCRGEGEALGRLHGLLAASRIPVDAEFRREVLAALPAAGWEARHPRSWAAALILLAALGGGAAALVGSGGAVAGGAGPFLASLAAVLDLFRSSVLAGAGLLAASWSGLGMAVGSLLGSSTWNLVAFAAVVLGLDVFFLRLLLRARRTGLARRAGEATIRPRRGAP